jgi:signal transduction histidine kinase
VAPGPAALWRSAPLRLALGIVAVVAAANLLTLGLAWLNLRAGIEAGLRANLDQQMAGLEVAATPAAMAALVAANARAADPAQRIFAFLGPDGRVTGNALIRFQGARLVIQPLPGGPALSPAGYLPRVERLAGGVLVVAESRAPLAELGRTFLAILVLSLAPTVLVSLAAGLWIARRAARRVAAIEGTLARLGAGELSARLPEAAAREPDDLGRVAQGVNGMAAALEASVAALRQVTTDIAHDLRTPVSRIALILADLRARLPEGSEAATLAARAEAEAARAVAVFRALLDIATIEGGRARARFGPVDLAAVARDMADLYEPAAEESDHRLLTEVPAGPVMVTGDRALLGQAVANLIENALRHTPAGCTVRLSVRPGDGAGGPELAVADDGPGIPEAVRARVTGRFVRGDGTRGGEGHGLGLALVAAIATAHGARLALEDAAPGLRVRLAFPSAAATPPAAT